MSGITQTPSANDLKVALVTPVADLYHRLWPDIDTSLQALAGRVTRALQEEEGLTGSCYAPVSTVTQVSALFEELKGDEIDLVIVALAPYCPSGVLLPALRETRLPLLLWPMQEMFELKPDLYDSETIKLNHGVHGVQDLAQVLAHQGRFFGVIHGHVQQADFRQAVHAWTRAGRMRRAMQEARPLQVGAHFKDMLDLKIGETVLARDVGVAPTPVSLGTLAECLAAINEGAVHEHIAQYRAQFDIAPEVDSTLLARTARGDLALQGLMEQHDCHACGVNFLTLCNDTRIGDALHVAASRLMNEGYGYAAEGDWVTAVLVWGMQRGFGCASFSEMFSVDYAHHRILLKHWGEGNIRMARSRPRMIRSTFTDRQSAAFAVADFEFAPGPALLVNLTAHPEGKGHLVCVRGSITADALPQVEGPRALFEPDVEDVCDLLTDYAYAGGTHHLALIVNPQPNILEKLCILSGWMHTSL
jgi:L-arabinose isomerase